MKNEAIPQSGILRRKRARRIVALLGGLVAISVVRAALGQAPPPVEAIRLNYDAPAVCPSEQAFLDDVTTRTARVRRAREDEPARTFSVVVEARGASFHASLEIEDRAGARSRRELDGTDCAELVSGVALVTALAVDPSASTEARPSTPSGPPAEGAVTPAPADSVVAPAAPVSPPIVPAVPLEAPAETTPLVTSSARSPDIRFRWSIGADADLVGGWVPSAAFGGGVHVEVAPTAGTFVPSFRFTARALTTQLVDAGVKADLTWWLARAEICPARLAVAPVVVEACGVLDVGAFSASGSGVDHPNDATRAWVSAGIAARGTWSLTRTFELWAEPGLDFPLRRYQLGYLSADGQTQATTLVSAVGGSLSLGAGIRFP